MLEHLQTPDKLQDAAGEIEATLRRRRIYLSKPIRVEELIGALAHCGIRKERSVS